MKSTSVTLYSMIQKTAVGLQS